MRIYLIGSLRNPEVPKVAALLREDGHIVFDDWHAVGPHADDHWRDYEKNRGRTMAQALEGHTATHTCEFDTEFLDKSDAVVLLMPAGNSGHLELGRSVGRRVPSFIVFPGGEPERWDMMYHYVTAVLYSVSDLRCALGGVQQDLTDKEGAEV